MLPLTGRFTRLGGSQPGTSRRDAPAARGPPSVAGPHPWVAGPVAALRSSLERDDLSQPGTAAGAGAGEAPGGRGDLVGAPESVRVNGIVRQAGPARIPGE